jgi:hypothetical protein
VPADAAICCVAAEVSCVEAETCSVAADVCSDTAATTSATSASMRADVSDRLSTAEAISPTRVLIVSTWPLIRSNAARAVGAERRPLTAGVRTVTP